MTLQKCTEIKQVFNTLVKLEQNITVVDSIKKSPLLVTQGEKKVITGHIINIIEFFLDVTGKELEVYQIQILAGDLYEKLKTDTLDDIVLMFKMARQGDFGKVYKCDTFEIMSWCDEYLKFKSAARERLITQRKKSVKQEEITGKSFHELPQELQDKFNNIGRKMTTFHLPNKAKDFMTTEKLHRELTRTLEKKDGKKKKKDK